MPIVQITTSWLSSNALRLPRYSSILRDRLGESLAHWPDAGSLRYLKAVLLPGRKRRTSGAPPGYAE
jgi:hypothetical protein